MKWHDHYDQHLTTASEAVKAIKSGDRVVTSHACGEPKSLVEAMVDRAAELERVEIVHMVAMGSARYCLPENARAFRHNSLFVGATTRAAVNDGRGDYTPCFFSEIPRLFRDEILPVDVALITVSPPDKLGFFLPGHLGRLHQAGGFKRQNCDSRRQSQNAEGGRGFQPACTDIDYFVPTGEPLIKLAPLSWGKPRRRSAAMWQA